MMPESNNRAVSAVFRVFGERETRALADVEELADCDGMHRGETIAFAILFPLTVWVAVSEPLVAVFGPVPGWLLGIPLAFLAMQLFPFALAGKSSSEQCGWWFYAALMWTIVRCGAGGIVGLFSYVWVALTVLNLTAQAVLAWRTSMSWKGRLGINWRLAILIVPHAAAAFIGWKYGWPWMFAAGVLIAVFFCRSILSPYSQVLGPVSCASDGADFLITIDDGPDPHDTPALLDLLDAHQTKAVFFMIGEKARAYPELAREVVRRGHEIGNHTHTHPQASFWCAGPSRTRREITECQSIIHEITGKKPRYFRAPVGHRNLFTHPITNELGLTVMAWNRRGFDAVEKDAKKVLGRILPDLIKADIVLLHEATPIATEVLAGVLARTSLLTRSKTH